MKFLITFIFEQSITIDKEVKSFVPSPNDGILVVYTDGTYDSYLSVKSIRPIY